MHAGISYPDHLPDQQLAEIFIAPGDHYGVVYYRKSGGIASGLVHKELDLSRLVEHYLGLIEDPLVLGGKQVAEIVALRQIGKTKNTAPFRCSRQLLDGGLSAENRKQHRQACRCCFLSCAVDYSPV